MKKISWQNATFVLLGILTGTLFVASREILFVLIAFFAIMAFSSSVGNIFAVKVVYRMKKIAVPLGTFILLFSIETYLNVKDHALFINVALTSLFSVGIIINSLAKESVGFSLVIFTKNMKDLYSYLKKYILKLSLKPFIGVIAELVLLYFVITHTPENWIKIPTIVFWTISGFCVVLFRTTPFVFEQPPNKIMNLAEVYGTSRLTYFIMPFLILQAEIHWIVFIFLFAVVYVGFVHGLQPYIFKTPELRDTIKILKEVKENPRRRTSQIAKNLEMEPDEVLEILQRLRAKKFVEDTGGKWSLHQFMQ